MTTDPSGHRYTALARRRLHDGTTGRLRLKATLEFASCRAALPFPALGCHPRSQGGRGLSGGVRRSRQDGPHEQLADMSEVATRWPRHSVAGMSGRSSVRDGTASGRGEMRAGKPGKELQRQPPPLQLQKAAGVAREVALAVHIAFGLRAADAREACLRDAGCRRSPRMLTRHHERTAPSRDALPHALRAFCAAKVFRAVNEPWVQIISFQ